MYSVSDRASSLPGERNIYSGRLRYGSPLVERMNELQIEPLYRKRALSYRKPEEHCHEFAEDDGMRPRTSSMPTSSTFRKPQLQLTSLGLNGDPDVDTYKVRSFEMNAKGKIISRSESLRSRSSYSIFSSEGDLCPLSHSSSSLSKESILNTVITLASRVMIFGYPAVGKTALAQQFMTSEYLGGFNTSTEPYVRTGLNDFHQYVSTSIHTLGDTLNLIISLLQNLDTVTNPVPCEIHHLIAVILDHLQSG